jgi:O-antigen ligase
VATAAGYPRRQPSGAYPALLLITGLIGVAIALGYAVAVGELGAFFIALAVVGALAVLFDFRIGAALLILLLPLSVTTLFPRTVLDIQGLNPLNLVLLATLVAYFLHGGKLRQLAPRPLLWLMIVPIVVGGVMGVRHFDEIAPFLFEDDELFSTPLGYVLLLVWRPLLIIAVAVLVGAAATKSEKPEWVLAPMAVAVWIIGLIMLGYIAVSGVRLGSLAGPAAREFYSEMGLHANALGRLFAVAYALLLFVWWETKNVRLKTALFFTLGIAVLAMVLTFSRGALLGFFVVNALFLMWKFNAKTVGLALLAGALAVAIAPDYLWGRITYGMESGDPNTVSAGRIDDIWLPLLPELWKSPLWGNGLGSTMWSTPLLTGAMLPVGHPHNAYLEALLDLGVIGLVVMMAFYLHVWNGFRNLGSNPYLSTEMRALFQGGVAALICFLVTGGAGSSFRPEPEFGFLWLAIGLMYGVRARKPKS